MAADDLPLQLELHDGNGLVHLGQGVHAGGQIVLVVRVAGHEPGAVLIGLLREADHVPQADAVAVFHDIQGIVL